MAAGSLSLVGVVPSCVSVYSTPERSRVSVPPASVPVPTVFPATVMVKFSPETVHSASSEPSVKNVVIVPSAWSWTHFPAGFMVSWSMAMDTQSYRPR